MSDDANCPRDVIHEALQGTSHDSDGGLPENAMLMGWITVSEWMDVDGKRWLPRIAGDARGEQPPEWQTQGYLHNALFCGDDFGDDVSDFDDDEDEDE